MNIEWLGCPNYSPGRSAYDLVVIHTMDGTWQAANARFNNPAAQVSAHYGVTYDGGAVKQWVQESDTAWHAGQYDVNLRSIGIEHEDLGAYNSPRPDGLYATSAALVRDICLRHGIPIVHTTNKNGRGIIAHRETGTATACPDSLDVDRIISMAAQGATAPTGGAAALGSGDGSTMDVQHPTRGWFMTFYIGQDAQLWAFSASGMFGPGPGPNADPNYAMKAGNQNYPFGIKPVPGTLSGSWDQTGEWLRIFCFEDAPDANGVVKMKGNEYQLGQKWTGWAEVPGVTGNIHVLRATQPGPAGPVGPQGPAGNFEIPAALLTDFEDMVRDLELAAKSQNDGGER